MALRLHHRAVGAAGLVQRVRIGEQEPLCRLRYRLGGTEPQRGIFTGKAVAARGQLLCAYRVNTRVFCCVAFQDGMRAISRAIVHNDNVPLLTEHEAEL